MWSGAATTTPSETGESLQTLASTRQRRDQQKQSAPAQHRTFSKVIERRQNTQHPNQYSEHTRPREVHFCSALKYLEWENKRHLPRRCCIPGCVLWPQSPSGMHSPGNPTKELRICSTHYWKSNISYWSLLYCIIVAEWPIGRQLLLR